MNINNIPKNCCNNTSVGIPAHSLCPILGRVPRVDNGERVSKYSNLTAAPVPAMTRRRGRFPQSAFNKAAKSWCSIRNHPRVDGRSAARTDGRRCCDEEEPCHLAASEQSRTPHKSRETAGRSMDVMMCARVRNLPPLCAIVSSSERVCTMVFIFAAHYYWRARSGTMTTGGAGGPDMLVAATFPTKNW